MQQLKASVLSFVSVLGSVWCKFYPFSIVYLYTFIFNIFMHCLFANCQLILKNKKTMNWFLNCVKMVYAVVKSTYYHISRFLKQKDKKGCFKLLMFIAGWYSHMCTPKLISVLSSTHAFLLLLLYRFIKLGITKNIRKSCLYSLNDTHREKLCFTQFSARMAAWLLLTFSYVYTIN